MEILSINRVLALVAATVLMAAPLALQATKIARVSLEELYEHSTKVLVVKVIQTKISSSVYSLAHSPEKHPFIEQQAQILKNIKGDDEISEVDFFSHRGLVAGDKYVVFLTETGNANNLQVSQFSFGAIELKPVSMKEGVVLAARIAESYIQLPNALHTEPGVARKNEQASFVWVRANDLTRFLGEL